MISEIISEIISEGSNDDMEFWLTWVSVPLLVLLVVMGFRVLLVKESCGVLIGVSCGAHCPGQCKTSWLECLITLNIHMF